MTFNIMAVDVLVVLVVVVSAAYASWRGFVAESLAIVAWAAGAFAALYFGPLAASFAGQAVSPPWLALVLGYALVFVAVVIPLSFASHRFAENVKRSAIGSLDRAMGLAFGVIRGLAIVGIGYIIYSYTVPVPRQPEWLTRANSLPVLQASSEVLLSLVPDHVRARRAEETQARSEPVSEAPATREQLPRRPAAERARNTTETKTKKSGKTYGARDRRALDSLIEATGSDRKP